MKLRVQQTSKDYLAAVQRNDPKAMAEFWTANGIYVDENGQSSKARELLEKAAESKDDGRPQTKITAVTLRLLTADSATEDGTSETTTPDQSTPVKTRFSEVWVRQNGKWMLDSLRESRIVSETINQGLTQLEPFVGEWTGESGGATIRVTAAWSSTKTFLRRDISIKSDGNVVFTAMQMVGWDPVHQHVRPGSLTATEVTARDPGHKRATRRWYFPRACIPTARRVRPRISLSLRIAIRWFGLRLTSVSKDSRLAISKLRSPAETNRRQLRLPQALSTAGSSDAAKKASSSASDTWRRVETEFKTWSDSQVVYTPQQIEATKAKLVTEIEKMTAPELQKLIAELDAKLKYLLSKDGVEAREWLGQ